MTLSEQILAAHKAGDVDALANIALALAQKVAVAEELERREAERKAKDSERARKYRASRDITLRHVTSRDVTPCHVTPISDVKDIKALDLDLKGSKSTRSLESLEDSKSLNHPDHSSDKSTPWIGLLAPIWEKHYGGKLHRGRTAKALRPVVAELGETETALRFERYCATTPAQFASVEKFASVHGSYAVGAAPGGEARTLYELLLKLDICGVDASLARDRMRFAIEDRMLSRDEANWIWSVLGKELDGMLIRTAPEKIAVAHLETVLARRTVSTNGTGHE